MKSFLSVLVAFLTVLLSASRAHAYVGPGVGVTMIGAFLALMAAVGTALGAILFGPVRALLRKMRKRDDQDKESGDS